MHFSVTGPDNIFKWPPGPRWAPCWPSESCYPGVLSLFVQKICVNIYVCVYMYVHSLYEFCYRPYIQRECHSVLAKLHRITFYRIISGECAVPGLNATFCFLCVLLFDKIVSCSLIKVLLFDKKRVLLFDKIVSCSLIKLCLALW